MATQLLKKPIRSGDCLSLHVLSQISSKIKIDAKFVNLTHATKPL